MNLQTTTFLISKIMFFALGFLLFASHSNGQIYPKLESTVHKITVVIEIPGQSTTGFEGINIFRNQKTMKPNKRKNVFGQNAEQLFLKTGI